MTKVAKNQRDDEKKEKKPPALKVVRPDTQIVEQIRRNLARESSGEFGDDRGTFFSNKKIMKATQHEAGHESAAGEIV